MKNESIDNLFEQTKGLELRGARLSGEPEVLHYIEDYFREVREYPIVRNQIRRILELVPSVFPFNWKSPTGYDGFNPRQKEAYKEIKKYGRCVCTGPIIQAVIELGINYRNKYIALSN